MDECLAFLIALFLGTPDDDEEESSNLASPPPSPVQVKVNLP